MVSRIGLYAPPAHHHQGAKRYALAALPHELLLHILAYLDLPDLLACSRISHLFRSLSLDPILHRHRLHSYRLHLSLALPHRPSLSSLRPPTSTIYLTPTSVAARKISRSFVSTRLSQKLRRRPPASSLVSSNILPSECYGDGGGGLYVSPSLVGAKRGLERERVKDGLRAALERWRGEVEKRARRAAEEGRSVGLLVRRFAAGKDGGEGKGGRMERGGKGRRDPARANVLGLRRFWEGVGRQGKVV